MLTTGGIMFTGGFTVTAMAQAIAAATDDYFKYVTMLLKGEGTNGAQNNTVLDSSANNFTVTRNGNTTQGTFSPYGDNWSNYFDGTGDRLSVPAAASGGLDIRQTDATVEGWFYPTSTAAGEKLIVGNWGTGAGPGPSSWAVWVDGANIICHVVRPGVNYWDAGNGLNVSAAFLPNQWNHFALVGTATTCALFLNGNRVGSNSAYAIGGSVYSTLDIGGYTYWNNYYFVGYMSNIRILKGTALYDPTSSTYTVPTSPLTAIANTQLLTCQSNRFIDKSSNAFVVTRTGDASVQRFSPFAPSSAYNASTIGGSMYFDGTGDYLTTPNATALQLGGVNFTIECWVKAASQNSKIILSKRNNASSHEWLLYTDGSGNIAFTWNQGTTWVISSIPLNNSWQHIAVVNVGTTVTLYVNGVSAGSASAALTNSTNTLAVGAGADGGSTFTGYISDARIVKGTAVYTGAFTPPTAPLTAISGTSLLLSGTNAGIIDTAMVNNIETVGNAQVSTTQKKFGTASIAFDGTGDYLLCTPGNSDLYAFGSGDFTIEFWLYVNTTTGAQILYDSRPGTTSGAYPQLYLNTTSLRYRVVGVVRIDATNVIVANTWYHIALCRSGTSTKLFRNGVQIGITYTDSTPYLNSSTGPRIGIDGDLSSNALNGYIDDLRVTKGYARYTTNFTAPTATFPGA